MDPVGTMEEVSTTEKAIMEKATTERVAITEKVATMTMICLAIPGQSTFCVGGFHWMLVNSVSRPSYQGKGPWPPSQPMASKGPGFGKAMPSKGPMPSKGLKGSLGPGPMAYGSQSKGPGKGTYDGYGGYSDYSYSRPKGVSNSASKPTEPKRKPPPPDTGANGRALERS